jgi:hypothetical protein
VHSAPALSALIPNLSTVIPDLSALISPRISPRIIWPAAIYSVTFPQPPYQHVQSCWRDSKSAPIVLGWSSNSPEFASPFCSSVS